MLSTEQVRERLSDLGFETEENEGEIILAAIKRAEQTIVNYCNCESIPEGLIFAALDMACGEYLATAKCRGDDEEKVKSVTEGDISVSFNEEESVVELADRLIGKGMGELVSFRRIKW